MIKLALVGAGGIGKIWADALKQAKEFEVKAVVDIDAAKAKTIADGFPGAAIYGDIKEALEKGDFEAVVIATPHAFLAPISKSALEAGKHVLCEKPTGISSAEVAENLRLAASAKRIYMIGFNHRYHPAYMEAKKLVDKGEIGKVICVRARYGFGGRAGYEKEWRFDKKISGGGELIDQGMHMIDMARWFMGDFVDALGFAENLFWGGEVEDNGFLLLRTADKRVAQIHVSWTNWEWVHSFEIFGDKGYLSVDGLDKRYRGPEKLTVGKVDPRSGKFPVETVTPFPEEKKEDSFVRELEEFAAVIGGEMELQSKGEDVLEVLKIVEKVYAQAGK
ncbi:MAG: Gfo/Idh/MocA family oxidoreductase [Candidatus Liptonbacteria bacterium]|nr:Gfo/Idh/MocA family oxidoreductase [Candidatus Liptonbacteria bacterium]